MRRCCCRRGIRGRCGCRTRRVVPRICRGLSTRSSPASRTGWRRHDRLEAARPRPAPGRRGAAAAPGQAGQAQRPRRRGGGHTDHRDRGGRAGRGGAEHPGDRRGRALLQRLRHRGTEHGGGQAAHRVDPAAAAVPGAPADPRGVHDAGAGRGGGAGLGGRDRAAPGGGGRLPGARGRRPGVGAVQPAGVHPRQRRHLAATPTRRSATRPRAAGAGGGDQRRHGGGVGSGSPGRARGGGGHGRRRAGGAPGVGADCVAGPDEVAVAHLSRAHPGPAAAGRGVRHGAVLAQRGLPRGAAGVRRQAGPEVRGPMTLPIGRDTSIGEAVEVVRGWVAEAVPAAWRDAAAQRGHAAIRRVRSFADYEAWYPTFAESGLVVPTWPVAYGGLDLTPEVPRRIEQELAPYNLGRLNPLGLNLCAPALFAHGTEDQRLRYLPPIVDNTEKWCQLFSEPGAGSDLASLATRAERDGDGWLLSGQKVWTTWAHVSDWAVCLARTNPAAPKRRGITYFLVDMHAPGIEVRPLRHIGGEVDFNEVFLDAVPVPDTQRVGDEGAGWRVAGATLSGGRQMGSGSGAGGVERIGGADTAALIALAQRAGRGDDPVVRQRVVRLWGEEQIRRWTNA